MQTPQQKKEIRKIYMREYRTRQINKDYVKKTKPLYYIKNRDRILQYQRDSYRLYNTNEKQYMKNYRLKQKQIAIEYKGGCCQICGYNKYYAAMDFHHPNGRIKGEPKKTLTYSSAETMKPILDKLILLCSNCHRAIHSGEITDPFNQGLRIL